jgi:hypothetical protein
LFTGKKFGPTILIIRRIYLEEKPAGFQAFTFNFLIEEGITIFTNGSNGFHVYSAILAEILGETPKYIKAKKNEN